MTARRRRSLPTLLLACVLGAGPVAAPTWAQVVPANEAPALIENAPPPGQASSPTAPTPAPQKPAQAPTPASTPAPAPSPAPESTTPAAKPGFPTLTGRVVDDARLLDAGTVSRLTSALAAHEAATSEQVVVVTVPSLNGMPIEDFGYQLGRQWGIGQKGKDNGALLIVARDDRKLRIEVGYGLEGKLTDAQSSVIINQIITPAFRQNDYAGGVSRGVAAILEALGTEPGTAAKEPAPVETGSNPFELFIGFMVLLVIVFARFNPFRRKRTFGERVLGAVTGGLLAGGGRRGGGFGGFGGGGGGGGFRGGGGGFGGGGASGGW